MRKSSSESTICIRRKYLESKRESAEETQSETAEKRMVNMPVKPMGSLPQMLQEDSNKRVPIRRTLCRKNLFKTERKDGDIDKLYAEEEKEKLRILESRYNIDFAAIERHEKKMEEMGDKGQTLAECNQQQQENVGIHINRISKTISRRVFPDIKKPYAPSGLKGLYADKPCVNVVTTKLARMLMLFFKTRREGHQRMLLGPPIYKVIKMKDSNVPKHKNNNIIIDNNHDDNNNNNTNNNAQLKCGNSKIMDKKDDSGNNDNNGNK